MAGILPRVAAEDLAPQIIRVQNLADQLDAAAADAGFTDELHRSFVYSASTFRAAMDSWATKQAAEVVDGTRTRANWDAYGVQLEKQAASFQDTINEQSGWFAKTYNFIATTVLAGIDAVAAKVADLRSQASEIGAMRQRVLEARPTLAKVQDQLTDESQDTLFGGPFDVANATWSKFTGLVDALEAMVSFVRGGSAKLQATPSGDVAVVPLNGLGRNLLGALPALAAGTVLATIAICAALAVSLRAYYQHADQVARAELESQENALLAAGKISSADLTKIRDLRAKSDAALNPPGSDLGSTIAKAAVGGTALAVGIWGAWRFAGDWLLGRSRK